ncbi:MAG: DMT family transporter [Alphaproteobacteria bacterium]|nr:DMT family transporter [Alphaproteobacteria bacterium]
MSDSSPAAPPPRVRTDHRLAAAGLMCTGMLFFCVTDALAKYALSLGLSPFVVSWARYIVGLPYVLALLPVLGWRRVGHTNRAAAHVARGSLVVCSGLCFFTGLQFLALADATALGYTSPFFVAIMGGLLLGERVGSARWAAIAVGAVGMLVIVRPGGEGIGWAAAFPVLSSFGFAGYQILTRRVGATDAPLVSLFWQMLVGLVLTSLLLPLGWTAPDGAQWLALLALGAAALLGHLALTMALTRAPAAHLAPFTYSSLIWATAIGWLAFGTAPDGWTILGGAILAATGIAVTRLKD